MGRGAAQALGAAALAVALADCSGQPFTPAVGDGGRGGDSSAADQATPPDIPDGGQPSNGSTVGCGPTECTIANTFCCVAPGAPICVGKGGVCGGVSVTCDEAANCSSGVCCVDPVVGAVCKPICGANPQLCRTNSECPNKNCMVTQCDTNGQTETCGGVPLPFCP